MIFVLMSLLFLSIGPNSWASGAIAQRQQHMKLKQQQQPKNNESLQPPSRAPEPEVYKSRGRVSEEDDNSYGKKSSREKLYGEKIEQSQPEDVVTLSDIWQVFEKTSESWSLIMDRQAKVATVEKFINDYKKEGVILRKSPDEYVDIIDSMTQSNQAILTNSFKGVLKFVAIVEYDFDNGQNKDELARKILGEKFYNENRKRLRMK